MPPGAATASGPSSARTGAQLRTGKLEGLRERMGKTGRGAFLGLSMLGSHPAFQRDDTGPVRRDPATQMNESNHAMRQYNDPVLGSMPKVAQMRDDLNEWGMTREADELDRGGQGITDANAESEVSSPKIKSGAKGAKSDAMQKTMEMAKKKLEELIAEARAELKSDLGPIDEGELLLILNTLCALLSILRAFMGIFSKSLEKYSVLLDKIGLPVPKHLKIIGGATTSFKFLLWTGLITIILFLFIFQVLIFAAAADGLANPGSNAAALIKAVVQ